MSIVASEGSGREFAQVPPGLAQGVCYDIWDIGFQRGEYLGQPVVAHKIIIGFEVDELVKDGEFEGKRMTLNKFYTLSLHKKAALRAELESWRGKPFTADELEGFDVEKLIGANGMLNVVHSEKGKAKIANISPLMKNLAPMQPENKRTIPKWVQDYQEKSVKGADEPEASGDGIPF